MGVGGRVVESDAKKKNNNSRLMPILEKVVKNSYTFSHRPPPIYTPSPVSPPVPPKLITVFTLLDFL